MWIGAVPQSAEFASLLNQARSQGTRIVQRSAGEHFAYGSVTVDVFWPPHDQGGGKPNNNDSLIMRFAYDDSAVLAEGDAEKKVERYLAGRIPHAQLWNVGHNGSLTSTSGELLASVQPRWAVISVGAHNSFGHPRKEILERLDKCGAGDYRTDLNGAVTFYLEGVPVRPSAAPR